MMSVHSPSSAVTHPELAQYLYTEVIDSLTIDVFGFILATSVLDILEPDACKDITGAGGRPCAPHGSGAPQRADGNDRPRADVPLPPAVPTSCAPSSHERDPIAGPRCTAAPPPTTARGRRGPRPAPLDRGRRDREGLEPFGRRSPPRFFEGGVTAVTQWTEMLGRPRDRDIDVDQGLDMALTLVYTGDVDAARVVRDRRRRARPVSAEDPGARPARLSAVPLRVRERGLHQSRAAKRAKELLPGVALVVGRAARPVRSRCCNR